MEGRRSNTTWSSPGSAGEAVVVGHFRESIQKTSTREPAKHTRRRIRMYEYESLSHSRWECKYHVVSFRNAAAKCCTASCGSVWEKYFESWPNCRKAILRKATC
jgi:hypothetical protein